MKLDVKFAESNQSFNPQFGEVHKVSDGGYERGYAEGYEVGKNSTPDYFADRLNNSIKDYSSGDVVRVPTYAFWGCTSLESVSLSACTNIDTAAFQNCVSLKSAKFPNCTEMGGTIFRGCSALANIEFPLLALTSTYAFAECSSLTSVDLPQLKTLGGAVFSGCSALKYVKLSSVTSVGAMAFQHCTSLTTLVIEQSVKVPSLAATTALDNTPIKNGTGFVYVPDNLVDSYKTAKNWSTYANQIKPISELEGGA